MTVTHTLQVYTGSDNYVNIYYSPHLTSPIYTYLQVSYNTTAAVITNYSNMNSLYFDPDGTHPLTAGFSMLKNQLVVLPKDISQANMYTSPNISSVQIFTYSSEGTYSLLYDLVVNTSLTAPCPANCSGNGFCLTNGSCRCDGAYIGYDCSVLPEILLHDQDAGTTVLALGHSFVKIPQSEFTASSGSSSQSQSTLTISLNTVECSVELYMKQQGSSGILISPFSYSKALMLSQSNLGSSTVFGALSTDYWLLFINNGAVGCSVSYNLKQDSKACIMQSP